MTPTLVSHRAAGSVILVVRLLERLRLFHISCLLEICILSHLVTALVVFACVFGAALSGMLLRSALPDHHFGSDTKDSVKLAMGLVATMAGSDSWTARRVGEGGVRQGIERRDADGCQSRLPRSDAGELWT